MYNIEIAPDEYYIFCTYDEAVLYCFTLEIDGKTGWRLPTQEEYSRFYFCNSWALDDLLHFMLHDPDDVYKCVPCKLI